MAAENAETDAPGQDDADDGCADEPRAGPRRRCIATGAVRDKTGLLRFVVDPEGTVVPDPGEKLPGRGIWCVPRRDMLERARRRRQFQRAARANVTVPADLADHAARLLRERCLRRVGLAQRGGAVLAGFEKVRAALAADRAVLLLEARDGAADGRDKLVRLGRARRPGLPVVTVFTAAELAAALGRDRVVHVAMLDPSHADRLRRDADRLLGLLPPDAAPPNDPTDAAATDTEERNDERAGAT